jgi:hypothetical protein
MRVQLRRSVALANRGRVSVEPSAVVNVGRHESAVQTGKIVEARCAVRYGRVLPIQVWTLDLGKSIRIDGRMERSHAGQWPDRGLHVIALRRSTVLADRLFSDVSTIVRTGVPFLDSTGTARVEATVKFDRQTVVIMGAMVLIASIGIAIAAKVA